MTQQTASTMMYGATYQASNSNSHSDETSQAEQYSWQQYYEYAQQLQAAGDQAQADRYYMYARQLYNATIETEQPVASYEQAEGHQSIAQQSTAQQSTAHQSTEHQSLSRQTDDSVTVVALLPKQENSAYAEQNDSTVAEQEIPADGGRETSAPEWEGYYNYAKQLYEAGYTEEAMTYYEYAQQLFSESAEQADFQTTGAGSSDSAPPQYADDDVVSYMPQQTTASVAPQYDASASASAPASASGASYMSQQNTAAAPYGANETVSYMPQQSTSSIVPQYDASASYMPQQNSSAASVAPQYTSGDASYMSQQNNNATQGATVSYLSSASNGAAAASAYGAPQPAAVSGGFTPSASWGAEYMEDDEPLVKPRRAKRPLKQRIKIWTAIVTVSLLLVGTFGFIALFNAYKTQLGQTAEERAQNDSFVDAAIQPMIDGLSSAFDKTIRLSDAAQPLMYELNLRDTPPESYNSNAGDTVETAAVSPLQNAAPPSPAPQLQETAPAPVAAAETAQAETETAADTDANDAENTNADEAATAPETEETPTQDKQLAAASSEQDPDEPSQSDSRRQSRRSKRSKRRSHRSRHNSADTHDRQSSRNEFDRKSNRSDLAKNKGAKENKRSKLSDDPIADFLL